MTTEDITLNPNTTTSSEPLGDYALVETMPDCWREAHKAAGNWGTFPGNCAVREWLPTSDALQLIADDPDKYAHIVKTSDEEPT